MWKGLFLFSVLICHQAAAALFVSPVGHREAFLGNAGVALKDSPGNVIFNPAGSAFRSSQTALSLSGSSVSYQEYEGQSYSRDSGELLTHTLLVSSLFEVAGDLQMGVFYSYPGDISDYRRTQGATSILTSEASRQAGLAGLTYSSLLKKNWGWGIGINIVYKEYNDSTTTNRPGELGLERRQEQDFTLVLNPGLLWEVSDTYQVGLTLPFKALNLYSQGDLYQASMETGDGSPTENFRRYTPHSENLFAISFGQVVHWRSNVILLDVTYAPESGTRKLALENDDEFKSLSLGFQTPVTAQSEILLGLNYAQWSQLDFYTVTGGLAFKIRDYEGNVGVYYKKTRDHREGGLAADTVGFLYSSLLSY